jgi:hypothetical protein
LEGLSVAWRRDFLLSLELAAPSDGEPFASGGDAFSPPLGDAVASGLSLVPRAPLAGGLAVSAPCGLGDAVACGLAGTVARGLAAAVGRGLGDALPAREVVAAGDLIAPGEAVAAGEAVAPGLPVAAAPVVVVAAPVVVVETPAPIPAPALTP